MQKKKGFFEILNAPAYSLAEASRLTGLSAWRVSSYLRGYSYKYEIEGKTEEVEQPRVVEQSRTGSTYVSFLDIVDLLIVKELLKRKFSLQYLRVALAEAKEILGTPHFARSTFYTHSREIILQLPEDGHMIALMKGKQPAIPQIVEQLSKKLDFEDLTDFGFASRYYPIGRDQPIVVDPQVSFGLPTVTNRGVQTAQIYDLYLGEGEQLQPVSEWFNIPAPEIQAAIRYERSIWM